MIFFGKEVCLQLIQFSLSAFHCPINQLVISVIILSNSHLAFSFEAILYSHLALVTKQSFIAILLPSGIYFSSMWPSGFDFQTMMFCYLTAVWHLIPFSNNVALLSIHGKWVVGWIKNNKSV